MSIALKWLIVLAAGYLMGNFSSGITSGLAFGRLDIRKYGSKSTGATNVLRTLGWLPSVLTLLGDALKGLLAALLGQWLLGRGAPTRAALPRFSATTGRYSTALGAARALPLPLASS